MMNTKLLPFLLLIGYSITSFSQANLTITSSNMPGSNDSARYSNTNPLRVNTTVTGPNTTWLFDTLTSTGQGVRSFKTAMQTPYAFFFIGLNKYGEKIQDTIPLPAITGVPTITDIYSFYKKTSSEFSSEGLGVKLSGFPVPNYYSDDDELYKFPLNYTDRDSSTFKFSTITTTLVPFVYKKQGHRITEVDGWGTITTPYGTQSCLRVVSTQYSMDTLKGTITVGTFTIPINIGFPNYQRSYQWLTTTEKIPYLEVSGNLIAGNFTPTQARYRDSLPSNPNAIEEPSFSINKVYPNPTSKQLTIQLSKEVTGSISIEVFDLAGKLAKKEIIPSSNRYLVIDTESLLNGMYTLRVTNNKHASYFKFSKN